MVVLKVTNSTPAGAGERGHGLALANVRERLALLHDVQAQFKTVFKDGVGYDPAKLIESVKGAVGIR